MSFCVNASNLLCCDGFAGAATASKVGQRSVRMALLGAESKDLPGYSSPPKGRKADVGQVSGNGRGEQGTLEPDPTDNSIKYVKHTEYTCPFVSLPAILSVATALPERP